MVERSGKCLGKLINIRNKYDSESGVSVPSGHHTSKSLVKDLFLVLEELNKAQVFKNTSGRKHSQFPKFTANVCSSIKEDDLLKWLKEQLRKHVKQLKLC